MPDPNISPLWFLDLMMIPVFFLGMFMLAGLGWLMQRGTRQGNSRNTAPTSRPVQDAELGAQADPQMSRVHPERSQLAEELDGPTSETVEAEFAAPSKQEPPNDRTGDDGRPEPAEVLVALDSRSTADELVGEIARIASRLGLDCEAKRIADGKPVAGLHTYRFWLGSERMKLVLDHRDDSIVLEGSDRRLHVEQASSRADEVLIATVRLALLMSVDARRIAPSEIQLHFHPSSWQMNCWPALERYAERSGRSRTHVAVRLLGETFGWLKPSEPAEAIESMQSRHTPTQPVEFVRRALVGTGKTAGPLNTALSATSSMCLAPCRLTMRDGSLSERNSRGALLSPVMRTPTGV